MKYTVLGVSAGNGVMLYPFRKHLIANFEVRKEYYFRGDAPQWELNFPNIPIFSEDTMGFYDSEGIDVIIGHPKCGNSSMFALSRGKKFTSHAGEPSLELFFKAVAKFKPKIWALENLPKLTETVSIESMTTIDGTEYGITQFNGSVASFGNSQISRQRLVLFAVRKDIWLNNPMPEWPCETPDLLRRSAELLQSLPPNGHFTESLSDTITVYGGFKATLAEMQEFWMTHPKLRHYPASGNMGTAPGVYINRFNDYPLTVRKTNRQFNHNGVQMSPRELARIQGIPDSFKILSNGYPLKTLINKGRFTVANTPPYEVGAHLKDMVDEILN